MEEPLSNRKGKGGFNFRLITLLGPAGVKKKDIRWQQGTAHITCLRGKEVAVRRIISQIDTRKVKFMVNEEVVTNQ